MADLTHDAIVDTHTLRLVVWYLGMPGGVTPGTDQAGRFTSNLLGAFWHAPADDLDRLQQQYPAMGEWMRAFRDDRRTAELKAYEVLASAGVTL